MMKGAMDQKAWVKDGLAPVLVLILVATTSFLFGRQGRPTVAEADASTSASATQSKTVSAPTSVQNTNVIDQIAQTLAETVTPTTSNPSSASQSAARAPVGLININTATATELEELPGIGPSYAKGIIDYRTQNGPFVRVDDLDKVKGIGPKTLEKLRPLVTI
jgi:competence protein ComEA